MTTIKFLEEEVRLSKTIILIMVKIMYDGFTQSYFFF